MQLQASIRSAPHGLTTERAHWIRRAVFTADRFKGRIIPPAETEFFLGNNIYDPLERGAFVPRGVLFFLHLSV